MSTHDEDRGDELELLLDLVAVTCIEAETFDQGLLTARADGATEAETVAAEIDAHLGACAHCRRFLASYREVLEAKTDAPSPEEPVARGTSTAAEGATTGPAAPPATGQRRPHLHRLVTGIGIAAGAVLLAVFPRGSDDASGSPLLAPLATVGGQIKPTMGAPEPAAAADPTPAPTTHGPFAPTGFVTVKLQNPNEGDDATIYVFSVADGTLGPSVERFVERRPNWTGVRVKASVKALFGARPGPHALAFCAARVAPSELEGQTIAAVNDGGDARCLVDTFVVR